MTAIYEQLRDFAHWDQLVMTCFWVAFETQYLYTASDMYFYVYCCIRLMHLQTLSNGRNKKVFQVAKEIQWLL